MKLWCKINIPLIKPFLSFKIWGIHHATLYTIVQWPKKLRRKMLTLAAGRNRATPQPPILLKSVISLMLEQE